MKANLNLDRDSLLFYFLTTYGDLWRWDERTDSCEVVKNFVGGVSFMLLLIFIGVVGGIIEVLIPGIMGFVYFKYGVVDPDLYQLLIPFIGTIILICIASIVILIKGWFHYYQKRTGQKPYQKPGVLKKSFRAFKDKVCIPIDITKKEGV